MSTATETAAKMTESLPEAAQERVVEELRVLVEEIFSSCPDLVKDVNPANGAMNFFIVSNPFRFAED